LKDDNTIALVWSGTAGSAVDLSMFLPSGFTWFYSDALTIDSAGNVFGMAEGDINGDNVTFAVEWSPVPEPATASLLLIAATGVLMRRRHNSFTSPS
jgi:hypothetical protein